MDGRWGRLRASSDVEWIGADFLDRSNRTRVPARRLLGITVSVRVRQDLRLALEGKNLGDARASDVAGFPLPGRSVFASVRVGSTSAHDD